MNCETYRNQILLSASGELPDGTKAKLKTHLETCDACREFENASTVLSTAARQSLPESDPHPSVMVAIRQAADARSSRGRLHWLPEHFTRWAACAALLTLIAGTTWFALAPRRPQAMHLSDLSAMVAMVREDVDATDSVAAIVEEESDLETLARQLLEMEGFSDEDLFADEAVLTLFEEPLPTTTQWRRIPSIPDSGCA